MARPRTFDEEQVLEQAVDLFREKGFDGISLPVLVERLGICRQSIYSVFGDKRGLYLRALERYGEREIDAKLELLAGPGSPLENLRTVLRGWADLATRCPHDGCLTATALVESRGDEGALVLVEAQVARLEGGFRDALERAQAAGEVGEGIQAERLAALLTMVAYGIGVLSRLPSSGPRVAHTISTLLELLNEASAS